VKLLIVSVLVVFAIPAVLIAWYKWDSARNRGSTFGYYGEYNRTSNALASIPGVTVRQGWCNRDISLEEFGFSIVVAGQPIELGVGETDSIRSMGREAAVAALKERIRAELASSTTNR